MSEDQPKPEAGAGAVRLDAVAGERPTPPSEPLFTPPVAEPTPTVPEADASFSHPAGTAAPDPGPSGASASPAERPEVLIGAAFAGGLVLATILKRLGR